MLNDERFDELDEHLMEAARDYNRPPAMVPRDAMWERIQAGRRAGGQAGSGSGGQVVGEQGGGEVLPLRRAKRPQYRRFSVPVGIAALLALAFGIGRLSVDRENAPVATGPVATSPSVTPPRTDDSVVPVGPATPSELATTSSEPKTGNEGGAHRSPAGPPARQPAGPSARRPAEPSTAFRLATARHLAQTETFLALFRAQTERGGEIRPAAATAKELLSMNRLLLDSPAASDRRMQRLLEDLELVLAQIAQLADGDSGIDPKMIEDGIEAGKVLPRLQRAVPAGPYDLPTQGVL